jgi:hypothetical protein
MQQEKCKHVTTQKLCMNDCNKIKCKNKRCNKLTTRKKKNSYLNVMSMIKIVTLQNEILQTHTMEKMQTKDNTKALQMQ